MPIVTDDQIVERPAMPDWIIERLQHRAEIMAGVGHRFHRFRGAAGVHILP